MAHDDDQQKVHDLIDGIRIAMLTTLDEHSRLVSRPMAVQELADDGTLWFFTADDGPKAAQLAEYPGVNLTFESSGTWVSVAGQASLVHDRAKIDELWNSAAEAWFPEGKDGEHVALLRVEPDTAEYWDSPGGRISTVLAYAKSKVTGDRPDVGENEVVEL